MQKLQNFTAKIAIGGARKFDHVTPILKELEWLTGKDKYYLEKCATIYKAVKGLYPDWHLNLTTVRENTVRSTRQGDSLYVHRAKTDFGARATNVSGPKLWNDLPPCITTCGSLYSFKSNLKKLLLKPSD